MYIIKEMNSRADIIGANVKCEHCGKGLKCFKRSRDWTSRKMHKTCWKQVQILREIQEDIRQFREEQRLKEEKEKEYNDKINALKESNRELSNSLNFQRQLSFI